MTSTPYKCSSAKKKIAGIVGYVKIFQAMEREGIYMNSDNHMIDEVLKHLDSELAQGAMRMSVVFDEEAREEKSVSHKCCHSYGRPATETVGLLDMYTDISAGASDRG